MLLDESEAADRRLADPRFRLEMDHPAALANYLKRGFVIFKEEELDVNLPAQAPDPWPGAERPQ